jgi:predicted ATPase
MSGERSTIAQSNLGQAQSNLGQAQNSSWHIALFGGITATKETTTITKFRTSHCELLLGRLATHPTKFHPREELREWLWPEQDPQKQRLRFKDALSEIRTKVGEDIFEKQGNLSVRLMDGITSDVDQFQTALLSAVRAENPTLRIPLLRTAHSLYKGDFLSGYYDDWVLLGRERLKETYFDVATRLILDLERTGKLDEAKTLRRDIATEFPEHPLPPLPAPPIVPDAPVFPPETGEGYFGREQEVQTIREWAMQSKQRLLTLLGPGGMGKTRLSKEALPEALFVSLAEVSDATVGFYDAIHSALGLTKGDAPVSEQVVYALNQQPAPMLILDNFEQIVDTGARLVGDLLAACPKLRMLVTSRRRLGVKGEQDFPLPPLPHSPGVALFLDRARRARPDFGSSPNSRAIVEEIVTLLEGLPLAIELCAARSVVLGPLQIREQLKSQIGFLVNRRYAPVERHSSVRVALDWSIHLLSPELKRVFARLSVFRGGWTLDAAETVCEGCGLNVLDALDDLQGHSLIAVKFDNEDETPRYDMLVVIREYAEEVLQEYGDEEVEDARENQKDFFRALAIELHPQKDVASVSRRIATELPNLRAVTQNATLQGDITTQFTLLDKLGGWLFEYGHWTDFAQWMDNIEGKIDDQPERLLRLCGLRGALASRQGDKGKSEKYWLRWLDLSEQVGDEDNRNSALLQLAMQYIDLEEAKKAKPFIDMLVRHNTTELGYLYCIMLNTHVAILKKENELASRLVIEFENALLAQRSFPADKQGLTLSLIRAYYKMGEDEKALRYALEQLAQDARNSRLSHMAILMDFVAPLFERRMALWEASLCYTFSTRIHTNLQDQAIKKSASSCQIFYEKYPNAPQWVLTSTEELWNNVDVLAHEYMADH